LFSRWLLLVCSDCRHDAAFYRLKQDFIGTIIASFDERPRGRRPGGDTGKPRDRLGTLRFFATNVGDNEREQGRIHGPENTKTGAAASPAAPRINAAVAGDACREVDELAKQLATFNQRIIQIEQAGTQNPTIELLKKQAVVVTGQIDHLRFSLGASQ
jgi:hypothetical protein